MSCNWPQSKLALASRYSCTRSRTRDRSASDPPTSRAVFNSTAGIRQFPKLREMDSVALELGVPAERADAAMTAGIPCPHLGVGKTRAIASRKVDLADLHSPVA